MFKASSFILDSELENYDNGCLPESSSSEFLELEFKSETLDNLLSELSEHFKIDKKEFDFNSCGEVGRVDICWTSRKAGDTSKPTKTTLAKWKKGEIDLFYNCASCVITETKQVDFDVSIVNP